MKSILLIALMSLAGHAQAASSNCAKFSTAVSSGSSSQKLKRFLDVQWAYFMTEFPEWATYVGYPGQDSRWTDQSLAALSRRRKDIRCQREALLRVGRTSLSVQDKVNYDLALRELDQSIEGEAFDGDYMPINHLNGFQIDMSHVFQAMPKSTAMHYENILKRLEKVSQLTADAEALMREGMRRQAMPVKAFMTKIKTQLVSLTPDKVEASPLFAPFQEMPAGMDPAAAQKIRGEAVALLREKAYPALKKFTEFFEKEYAPKGRERIAWVEMPKGKAWYAYLVKSHTTTPKNPDELHELGVREVDRITQRMNAVKEKAGFKGDLQAFNKFLLTDKRFKYKSKEELLSGYRDIAKRIDAELPKLFLTLPRLPYGVREMPSYMAKAAPAAHYIRGSNEAGRAGFFEANTEDLPSRTKWDMETLTMHEAVPGHHLQLALAQEMGDLPEFRKHGGYTAFIEGWALYAESLGEEMGFFKDPYSLYGHLSGEMMRAVRLVVDTGLHAKGWSKEQALAFYRSKMPISDSDSEIEIDRYITWPGQALAYKVGQLKFRELREASAERLGDKFDVRQFHDQVLKNGALPLEILEKNVKEWWSKVASQKSIRGAG